MLCISNTNPSFGMSDSHVAQCAINLSGSLPKYSEKDGRFSNWEVCSAYEEAARECSFLSEVINSNGEKRILASFDKIKDRLQLEKEVQMLQQQLHKEMELHSVLKSAVDSGSVTSPCLPSLPHDVHDILANIASLEGAVSGLERQIVSLQFQLSQERNERRLVEYRLKQSSSQSRYVSSSSPSEASLPQLHHSSEQVSLQDLRDSPCETSSKACSPDSITQDAAGCCMYAQDEEGPKQMLKHGVLGMIQRDKALRALWKHPNQLSEEMVRCMKSIFISFAKSSYESSKSIIFGGIHSPISPRGHLSKLSLWSLSEPSTVESWKQSPQVDLQCDDDVLASESVFDPYRVSGKLRWADPGYYGLAVEVSCMSVGKMQLEYAAGALRRFRLLVEQLARVNPANLSNNEKLAFWINLYNALIMHAYLAYGVPRSDLKLFSLMQKAAYTVGSHSFSATAIEYQILKMKPPLYRPQTALLLALHKLKTSEEQRRFSIDSCEPLVAFALSCGMYSSPAVRIYTAGNIMEELQEAQRDFIRAAVGVTRKGKLLVPKMLHCFAKGYVDDSNLAVWICRFLPPQQATCVEHCISQRRQGFLGSRSCGILPFDSRFRYLFLPDVLP